MTKDWLVVSRTNLCREGEKKKRHSRDPPLMEFRGKLSTGANHCGRAVCGHGLHDWKNLLQKRISCGSGWELDKKRREKSSFTNSISFHDDQLIGIANYEKQMTFVPYQPSSWYKKRDNKKAFVWRYRRCNSLTLRLKTEILLRTKADFKEEKEIKKRTL